LRAGTGLEFFAGKSGTRNLWTLLVKYCLRARESRVEFGDCFHGGNFPHFSPTRMHADSRVGDNELLGTITHFDTPSTWL
jgi:hypothetical protein